MAQITNQINAALPNAFYCAGLVSPNGTVLSSTGRDGFTAVLSAAGQYDITFATARAGADYPIILTVNDASGANYDERDDINARYWLRTTAGFQVRIRRDDNGSTAGGLFDCEFSFIVL